jgi:uncharacterized membrane protein
MMDGPMMGGMLICMIASTLFALVIMVTLIVQAVLQSRILAELRKQHHEHRPGDV